MTPDGILQLVIQLGAVGILLVVLWQVNQKIDKMIDLTFSLITKLIDKVEKLPDELNK